jgi:hypothetical protein
MFWYLLDYAVFFGVLVLMTRGKSADYLGAAGWSFVAVITAELIASPVAIFVYSQTDRNLSMTGFVRGVMMALLLGAANGGVLKFFYKLGEDRALIGGAIVVAWKVIETFVTTPKSMPAPDYSL